MRLQRIPPHPSPQPDRFRAKAFGIRVVGSCVLALTFVSCASVKFTRETETSGRFRSSGLSFTFLSIDYPKRAIDIARENASDSRQANLVVESQRIFPYLGPLDWIFDIISIRYARISGTWGFEPGEFASSDPGQSR